MNIIIWFVVIYLAIGTVFSMVMALSYKYSDKTKNSFNEYMDKNSLNREMIPTFIVATILFWGLGLVKLVKSKK